MKGFVMQLQNFSVNDGDGIRTTVFLAGCPLRCQWCANPEGISQNTKIAYYKRHCTGCGRCVKVCPVGIGMDLNSRRQDCIACGKCADVCPSGARKYLVSPIETEEIINAIKPQIPFYRQSGGGVTFSGGEATMQAEFLHHIASRLYDMGVDLALETCCYFDFDNVKDILAMMDMLFVDIKHMDSAQHKRYTGVGNEKILENIAKLKGLSCSIVVRVPVIGGVNDTDENIRATAEFVKASLPNASMELLPYHCYGEAKYEALGLLLPPDEFTTPSEERLQYLEQMIRDLGVPTLRFR